MHVVNLHTVPIKRESAHNTQILAQGLNGAQRPMDFTSPKFRSKASLGTKRGSTSQAKNGKNVLVPIFGNLIIL
jgi:hypothetical protein